MQEIAGRIQERLQVQEVLLATEDGLPLSTSMPSAEAEAWGGVGPKLFRKYDQETTALSMGSPRCCFLALPDRSITMWHEPGIYLILSHGTAAVSSDFHAQGATLAREISRICLNPAASA